MDEHSQNVCASSRNVGRVLRGQECYRPGDFFGLSKPLHRNLRNDFLRKFVDGFSWKPCPLNDRRDDRAERKSRFLISYTQNHHLRGFYEGGFAAVQPVVMADFTKAVVFTQGGPSLRWRGSRDQSRKIRYRLTKTAVKSSSSREVYTCRLSGPSGRAAADWFRTAS